ncbi:metal ABC transporter permease [Paenibacillus cremeus]|uniref:Metal ABC transporter permease n=1 Tax=Paenibacillus cremeus TaxID=2163881 RepID=A0A559K436_9BACL|nr:metal ABC transporter permease [Paenibacillus cremeus]TVY06899.1 metal ABC transporter permease [Paenibacillus cremeus]
MEMLHYDFMQRAFCAGGIVALIASVLGVYLMLRRQALMADTLSHVSLAGVAVGSILHMNPSVTGFLVAMLGGIAIEVVRRSYRAYSEMSIAIIMTGGLSTAVVLMSMNQSLNKGFSAYLFGSVVAVSGEQLWMMLGVSLITGIYFILLRRPLYQITFDEETAITSGLPVKWISMSFSVLTGMIVAVAMPVVGVLLVSALIILPAALAIRIASSFAAAVVIAMMIGVSGVFSGLAVSYKLNTPPGGTIALVLLLILLTGLMFKKALMKYRKARGKKQEEPVKESVIQVESLSFRSVNK